MRPCFVFLLLLQVHAALSLNNVAFCYSDLASKAAETHVMEAREYMMYIADELGISDFYTLGKLSKEQLLSIDEAHDATQGNEGKPRMLVAVKGVTEPKAFVPKLPQIEIEGADSHSEWKDIFELFPKQLKAKNGYFMYTPSPEITMLSHSSDEKLVEAFRDLNSAHNEFQTSFRLGESHKDYQKILKTSVDTRSLRHVNDKIFLYELKQILYLALHPLQNEDGIIFMNINSLSSVGQKVGWPSKTYKLAKLLLADAFVNLSKNYRVSLMVLPSQEEDRYKVQKRDKELQDIFSEDESKKESCFSSEENCEKFTSRCRSHGKCIKSGSCWSCKCSPTNNTTTGKTTFWAGSDCSKKDISSEANLFLWSAIALSICIVYAIKLLVNAGNEDLPGVLGAVSNKN